MKKAEAPTAPWNALILQDLNGFTMQGNVGEPTIEAMIARLMTDEDAANRVGMPCVLAMP